MVEADLYAALRKLADRQLKGERPNHTLQPTALVNEAFLKLGGQVRPNDTTRNQKQFLALAARAMRQVLVDYARRHQAQKRGHGRHRITLSTNLLQSRDQCLDTLVLHEGLDKLADLDARMAHVVELRFFGGLDIDEIADLLETSGRTIDRDWKVARAWLSRYLNDDDPR